MNPLPQEATEAVVAKIASAATIGGSTSAVLFGLSSTQWSSIGVIGGLVIALIGLVVNSYFKAQHLKIARDNARRLVLGEEET